MIIIFIFLVFIVLWISVKKPEHTLVFIFSILPLIPAGITIPIPGLRNFGLAQILFPLMFICTFILKDKSSNDRIISNIDILIIIFSILWSVVTLIHASSLLKGFWTIFILIPWYFIWFPIKVFINSEERFKKIIYCLISNAAVISLFAFIEYTTSFNLYLFFHPEDILNVKEVVRFGFTRSSGGLFPHPVPAGVYLVLVISFSLIYFKKNHFSKIVFVISLFSLFYFQSRAAIFALIMATIYAIIISPELRKKIFTLKSIILIFVVLIAIMMSDLGQEYIIMMKHSLDFSQAESFNLIDRYPDIFRAIDLFLEIPFWGYGPTTEATISIYRLVNEQPWFVDMAFKGGLIIGVVTELFLLSGVIYLSYAQIKFKNIPIGFRFAALVGFLAQTISMHLNRDSYSIFTSIMILAAIYASNNVLTNDTNQITYT